MATFTVYNQASGQELGAYEAASAAEAIEACVRDAGYMSVADMEAQLEQVCELQAVEA